MPKEIGSRRSEKVQLIEMTLHCPGFGMSDQGSPDTTFAKRGFDSQRSKEADGFVYLDPNDADELSVNASAEQMKPRAFVQVRYRQARPRKKRFEFATTGDRPYANIHFG